MDALLAIPALGYFLMPSLTSYSTSLNLLFFHMTWSTLVLSHSPLKVQVLSCLGVRALFFLVPSSLFLIFDTLLPSLAVGIKLQGPSALPTRTGGLRDARRAQLGKSKWYQVVGLSLFNVALSISLQAGVEAFLPGALKTTTILPMPWSIAKDLLKVLLLREIIQYYLHRYILHTDSNVLSRLHRKYHHRITAPYSFVTHYDHPLPYILWRFLPVYLPAVIFRLHLLTYLLFLSIISLEETLTLSGYTTQGVLLGGISKRQDRHSQSGGKGNYAPWGFLDWVHGTLIGQNVVSDVRDKGLSSRRRSSRKT